MDGIAYEVIETPSTDLGPALAQIEASDANLVLISHPSWLPTKKSIRELIFGYESGSRAIVARRPEAQSSLTDSASIAKLWLYLFFGARRKDPTSPVRLYDAEAFSHIAQVLKLCPEPRLVPHWLSALEFYFSFAVIGVAVSDWENTHDLEPMNFSDMWPESKELKTAIRRYRKELSPAKV